MPTHTVDLDRLREALDHERRKQGKSWNQLADELDLARSRFPWIASGGSISIETFVTLLAWLEMDAEPFVRPIAPGSRRHSPAGQTATRRSLSDRLRKDRPA